MDVNLILSAVFFFSRNRNDGRCMQVFCVFQVATDVIAACSFLPKGQLDGNRSLSDNVAALHLDSDDDNLWRFLAHNTTATQICTEICILWQVMSEWPLSATETMDTVGCRSAFFGDTQRGSSKFSFVSYITSNSLALFPCIRVWKLPNLETRALKSVECVADICTRNSFPSKFVRTTRSVGRSEQKKNGKKRKKRSYNLGWWLKFSNLPTKETWQKQQVLCPAVLHIHMRAWTDQKTWCSRKFCLVNACWRHLLIVMHQFLRPEIFVPQMFTRDFVRGGKKTNARHQDLLTTTITNWMLPTRKTFWTLPNWKMFLQARTLPFMSMCYALKQPCVWPPDLGGGGPEKEKKKSKVVPTLFKTSQPYCAIVASPW